MEELDMGIKKEQSLHATLETSLVTIENLSTTNTAN
jgi:hypothetical protein